MTHTDDINEAAAHCPRCGADYRSGFPTCADCGIGLVPGPSPAEEEETSQKDDDPVEKDWWDRPVAKDETENDHVVRPVRVAELPPDEARLLAGRLRADGIPATVYPPGPAYISYGTILAMNQSLSVLVPEEFEEQARAEIEDLGSSEPEE
ncbi:MAG: hypothetical protein ABR600_02325 [Actinomycetota bacterium]